MTTRRAGFTLLEIMLALGIFGLVAVTLYGTFARTLRSKGLAERRAEVTRLGRAAVGRMADEIGSAYYPATLREAARFQILKSGTETAPLDSIAFTALSSRPAGLDGRATDQRMIVYFFPRDRSGLRRDERPAGDANQEPAGIARSSGRGRLDLFADDANDYFAAFGASHPPALGTAPRRLLRREAALIHPRALDDARATAFLEDVASLELRGFDGREWLETWDSDDPNTRGLPRAVAIDLALYDAAGDVHHFPTAVDIPLRDGTASSGTTGPSNPSGQPNPAPTRRPFGAKP